VRMESFCIPFDIFDQKKKTKGFESWAAWRMADRPQCGI